MKNPMKLALVSVSDKTGVVEFAKKLTAQGVKILSTGGTAKTLLEADIKVIPVSEHTGFPEMMDGRVKTLHPRIHAGLLARAGIDDAALAEYEIPTIDLVVVNLYPFEKTVANPDCDLATAIENIDIGGPSMLRAAAKNHDRVTVVIDPSDYDIVLAEMADNQQQTTAATRFRLAQKVFGHTANYDAAIADYLAKQQTHADQPNNLPETYMLTANKKQDLRYGENPHQQAAFYTFDQAEPGSMASIMQHQGKPLSFNNIADTDAALSCVKQFDQQHACVIVKHANPCGVAVRESQLAAYEQALATDRTSAFGGIIAFNQVLEAETAQRILDNQFVEVIIAPAISEAALGILSSKPNVRALSCGQWETVHGHHMHIKSVSGGLLIQDTDCHVIDTDALRYPTIAQPDAKILEDLLFAWKVAKSVKSNAIVFAKDTATIGIGAGQMSRIDSTKIAARKAEEAKLAISGAVMASDAFFPFPDNVELAAELGIKAIIQPGGSMRDEQVIEAADKLGIVMVMTGIRHFWH